MSRRGQRIAVALAVAQVADTLGNGVMGKDTVTAHLDHLGVPVALRPLLPIIKVASSAALLPARRAPRLRVLVAAGLVAYYAAAAQYHLGAGDHPTKALPAVVFGVAAAAVLVGAASPAVVPTRKEARRSGPPAERAAAP